MSVHRRILIIPIGLVLLAGAAACSKSAPEHTLVVPVDAEIRLPMEQISDGNAHFFTYKLGDKNINFFARTDASGKIHTHFDACYTCYKYKMGYVQEDREVVCTACRIGFDLDQDVWDWVGPCVPVSLKHRIRDGLLIISVKKLEASAKLF